MSAWNPELLQQAESAAEFDRGYQLRKLEEETLAWYELHEIESENTFILETGEVIEGGRS